MAALQSKHASESPNIAMFRERERGVLDMEASEALFLPHVREYIISREEYLGMIAPRPSMHEFYQNCESYVSRSIQIDADTNTVTISGVAKPIPGGTLSINSTLLHLGSFNQEGEAEFFAQFNGPINLNPDNLPHDSHTDFAPVSSTWDKNGICMRFVIHRPTFKDWSYFQVLEPYARLERPMLTRDVPDIQLPSAVHRTVFLAHSMGYFETPRKATLREIGAQLGISHTMVARHLREAEAVSVGLLLALDSRKG